MSAKIVQIIKAGLLVGTLDILSAFTYYYIRTHETHFLGVFKFIASGIVGKANADAGGNGIILLGLGLHYTIALFFSIFFFLTYPYVRFMQENRFLTGIGYGLLIWMTMNLIVVPLSNVAARPFTITNALINIAILMVCVGLPLSLMASSFFGKRRP